MRSTLIRATAEDLDSFFDADGLSPETESIVLKSTTSGSSRVVYERGYQASGYLGEGGLF
jgi:hypothetical protein